MDKVIHTGLDLKGILHAGNHHLHVLDYNFNGTPTKGIKIKTNLPFVNGSQMPSVIIEGYNFGQGKPISLHLCWYIDNGAFSRPIVLTNGSYMPDIELGVEGGKVVIVIKDRQYYSRFTVRAFSQGMSEVHEWFKGWVATDNDSTGLANVVAVPYDIHGGVRDNSRYNDNSYGEFRYPRLRIFKDRNKQVSISGHVYANPFKKDTKWESTDDFIPEAFRPLYNFQGNAYVEQGGADSTSCRMDITTGGKMTAYYVKAQQTSFTFWFNATYEARDV